MSISPGTTAPLHIILLGAWSYSNRTGIIVCFCEILKNNRLSVDIIHHSCIFVNTNDA